MENIEITKGANPTSEKSDKVFLEIRKDRPDLFKMLLEDMDSTFKRESLWVQEVGKGKYEVGNIPFSDKINMNDIVAVVHDEMTPGKCTFERIIEPVNGSGWLIMENEEDQEKVKLFLVRLSAKVEWSQLAPGMIKVTWPLKIDKEIKNALDSEFGPVVEPAEVKNILDSKF